MTEEEVTIFEYRKVKWYSKNIELISTQSYSQILNIPEEIDRKKVTGIGHSAFRDKRITDVTLPSGLITIERAAFNKNLIKKVSLPDSIDELGSFAFSDSQIEIVRLSSGLKHISSNAFSHNLLEDLIIPNNIKSLEHRCFFDNNISSVWIPDGLQIIGSFAFAENQLTKVVIPKSVELISLGAFFKCPLVDIYFANKDFDLDSNPFDLSRDVTIYSQKGGLLEKSARKKNIPFVEVNCITEFEEITLLKDLFRQPFDGIKNRIRRTPT